MPLVFDPGFAFRNGDNPADVADAALPIAAYLDLLSDLATEVICTPEPLPFANATEPMTLNETGGNEGPYDDSADLANLDLSSGSGSGFLQGSMSRCLHRIITFCEGQHIDPLFDLSWHTLHP